MLRLLFAWIISVAFAQTAPSYIIFPSQAACLARSQQACVANGCDGVHTIYWWHCAQLNAGTIGPSVVTAGSYALKVESSGRFSSQGLTVPEQATLKAQTQVAPLFPAATGP